MQTIDTIALAIKDIQADILQLLGKNAVKIIIGFDDNAPDLLTDDTVLIFVAQTNDYSPVVSQQTTLDDTYGFVAYWRDDTPAQINPDGIYTYASNALIEPLSAMMLNAVIHANEDKIISNIEAVTMAASMRPQYQGGALVTLQRVNTFANAI